MSEEKVRLARSTVYLTIQSGVSTLSGILYFAFAARLLPTVADLGKVSAITMFSSLIVSVVILSIPSAVTKYYTENLGRGDSAGARGVISTGFRFGTLAALIGSISCLVFAPTVSLIFLGSHANAFLFRLLAVDLLFLILAQFSTSLLYGSQMFKEMCIVSVLSNSLKTLMTISLLLFGFEIAGIILGWTVADFLYLSLSLYFLRGIIRGVGGSFSLSSMFRYSAPIYGSTILSYIQSTIDRYIVLGLAGAQVLGLYSPATTAVLYVSYVSGSVASAIFPKASELFGKGDMSGIMKTTRMASRYSALIYSPLALGLAATSLPTIDMFAGSRYIGGAPALAIIAVASTILPLHNILYTYFASIGETVVFFISQAIAIVACALLAVLLVPVFGATGAGISRATLTLVYFIIMILYAKGEVRSLFDLRAFSVSALLSSIMALLVYLCVWISYSKYLLPVYILVGMILYILMLKAFKVIDTNDVNLLIAFVPSRLRGVASRFGRFLAT
ncbi:MAG: oligosaccharide flippase family protein [Candidatus Methanomethylicaceae archaeon]